MLAAALLAGCAAATSEPSDGRSTARPVQSTGDAPPSGKPVSFVWEKAHGGKLETSELEGRVSVLVFITTYDVPSQAQVKYLANLLRDHAPRLNGVAVVLEPPENAPLVAAYADALDLKFPCVLADPATTRGEGAFTGLHHVPAVAILDRSGREQFRHLGLLNERELESAVVHVEEATGVKKGVEPAASAPKP